MSLQIKPFAFKPFQREDYARGALQDGLILGHDTGLGKTIAMFTWPLLKLGLLSPESATERLNDSRLIPAKPVLLVVPADGHEQTTDEARKHFKTTPVPLDSQATFLRLAKLDPITGCRSLPPHFYITSYTQLSGNGVIPFPKLDPHNPSTTLSALNLNETHAREWFKNRAQIYAKDYAQLGVTTNFSWTSIQTAWRTLSRKCESDALKAQLDEVYHRLEKITPPAASLGWEALISAQQQFICSELASARHREYSSGIGEFRPIDQPKSTDGPPSSAALKIKCVYSPSLADLCADCFGAIVVDEGTKMKGEHTLISLGVRQINAPFRLVMSATPIKNRFPDVFRLAHYVCGGHEEPTARFPYSRADRDNFAEEFMVSERNVTREEASESNRRFRKLTPQICNVHRAWKLLAAIILRRRKADCGEAIVPKCRHVVRVPLGSSQAAVYQFHLKAKYRDKNGQKAVGAQLQALRLAAANPASELLQRPERDVTEGSPRSPHNYIPKVASTLQLITQVLERGEQVLVFSAFHDSLDAISTRLNEAGVMHLVLDGRISQARRGHLAKLFKQGPPRAVAEGLTIRASEYPVMLAGVECMAELHSFHLCNNVILTAYSWAWDKFEQGINRAHRMNLPWPVNVWSVICEGSIDRKLEANVHEKGDAAELVLDGHLLGEHPSEVNLAELLSIAHREFAHAKTIDELELIDGWPQLRSALEKAFLEWNKKTCFEQTPPKDAPLLPLWRRRSLTVKNQQC